MQAYKLFKIKKDGKLYPLYIYTNRALPMNSWLTAEEGERTPSGKVKSKLGELAYRPGFHCCQYPLADHIGKRMSDGNLCQAADTVWCEVEMISDVDYTEEAKNKGKIPRDQYLEHIPYDGFYLYKTNPSAKVNWYICGQMKITKILSQEEVEKICADVGLTAQITEQQYKSSLSL